MKMNETEQIIELIQGEPERGSSMLRTQKQEIKMHTVFLDEEIGEPRKYRDLIHNLFQADENDVFVIIINSPGGYLSSASAIIEAIKGSEAEVRAVLVGECHSAASIIALNCHNIIVTESANMMCHTISYGVGGNSHSVQRHADFSTKLAHKLLDSTYAGFLNPQELEDVKKGVEFWFDDKDIRKRLENRMKYMQEKSEKKSASKTKKKPKPDLDLASE